jgi:hypothetical protein
MHLVHICQKGTAIKFVGNGLVILNYDWWINLLKRKGKSEDVPPMEELLLESEKEIGRLKETIRQQETLIEELSGAGLL